MLSRKPACGGAIERERLVRFGEVIVRPDLDGAVAGIRDRQARSSRGPG